MTMAVFQAALSKRKNQLVLSPAAKAMAGILDAVQISYKIHKGFIVPHCPTWAPSGFRIATFHLPRPHGLIIEVDNWDEPAAWVSFLNGKKLSYMWFSEAEVLETPQAVSEFVRSLGGSAN